MVLDQHALRLPGRPRGVEHVRERALVRALLERRVRPGRHPVRVDVDAELLPALGLRQPRRERGGREHHPRPGVVEDEAQPPVRVVGVEHHERAVRLQHAEQRDQQVRPALQRDRDHVLPTHSELPQPACQQPGPPLQLPVGQLDALQPSRHPIRIRRRPLRDLHVHRRLRLVGGPPQPPLLHQESPLFLRLQRQLRNPQAVVGDHCAHSPIQVRQQPGDALAVVEIGPVVRAQDEPMLGHGGGQRELERVAPHLDLHALDPETLELRERHAVRRRGVEELEADLEERVAARVAVGLDRADDLLERHAPVLPRFDGRLLRPLEQLVERRVLGDVGAKHEHVDERADQRCELRHRPARRRGADHDLGLAGVPREHGLEDGEERHEERSVRLLRQGAEAVEHLPLENRGDGVALVGGGRRPRPVGEQLERLETAQALDPVVQVKLELRALDETPLPHGEVAELERKLGQLRGPPAHVRVVERGQVAPEDRLRPAVGAGVVQAEHDQV